MNETFREAFLPLFWKIYHGIRFTISKSTTDTRKSKLKKYPAPCGFYFFAFRDFFEKIADFCAGFAHRKIPLFSTVFSGHFASYFEVISGRILEAFLTSFFNRIFRIFLRKFRADFGIAYCVWEWHLKRAFHFSILFSASP